MPLGTDRVAIDATISVPKGAPFKDQNGKQIGTVLSAVEMHGGVECLIELDEGDAVFEHLHRMGASEP
jgi:hypothetical protein